MNILMMTNTYLPFVGGVERSVQIFTGEYRRLGHQVLIVAPSSSQQIPSDETGVLRVPAIQHFNGTDFSVPLPIPGILNAALKQFKPDIVHSHHPFIIGDSALRISAQLKIPIVFTFHTFYERYTHYVPGDSKALKKFVIALATGYANLCDFVFAPSLSVAVELRRRGVLSHMEIIPTGIETELFLNGDRRVARKWLGINEDVFVIGCVSRLAPEKNIDFLVLSVKKFLEKRRKVCFLLIGSGPCEDKIKANLKNEIIEGKVIMPGTVTSQPLIDCYHAMDLFVFASKTETQGLVITEAMASGVPVVALRASGVAEVIDDKKNGCIVENESCEDFVSAMNWVQGWGRKNNLKRNAINTASKYTKEICAQKALTVYEGLRRKNHILRNHSESTWETAKRLIKAEMDIIKNMTRATGMAITNK
ncbi:MAG: glycosyltransferase family 4 protein [Fibrobacter sp.]|nr:glycosyltransferase family 4 protein [Fibrobacter sp.]